MEMGKREVGNAILNTMGQAVLPLFSVCKKIYGGVLTVVALLAFHEAITVR